MRGSLSRISKSASREDTDHQKCLQSRGRMSRHVLFTQFVTAALRPCPSQCQLPASLYRSIAATAASVATPRARISPRVRPFLNQALICRASRHTGALSTLPDGSVRPVALTSWPHSSSVMQRCGMSRQPLSMPRRRSGTMLGTFMSKVPEMGAGRADGKDGRERAWTLGRAD